MSKHQCLSIYRFLTRATLALTAISPVFALMPVSAHASAPSSVSAKAAASIDADSLIVDSGDKAYLTGTSTASKIRITITASSTNKTIFKSISKSVQRNGDWSVRVNKELPDGRYTVSVYQDTKGKLTLLTKGTLRIGVPAVTLKVSSIALLTGGTAIPGSIEPISYLQVTNQGDATTTISGFWIQQNGTAPVQSIIGLSSVDDKGIYRASVGGIEGQTPFTGIKAYVPSGAIIGPHERKLFTLKAHISASAGQYAGTSLILNVSSVDAPATFLASFPILGTTWTL